MTTTDESGAPWPYDDVATGEDLPSAPTWDCPSGACQCHPPDAEVARAPHRILLFDGGARRMPGARCRVLENGILLNKHAPYADGSGAIDVEVRPDTRVLELEWAPASLPREPSYPYRKQYYVHLGESLDEGVHRRLHNLGFTKNRTLADNVREMQRAYLQPETGRSEDVADELCAFHDDGALLPIPKTPVGQGPTAPADQGSRAPSTTKSARETRPGTTRRLASSPGGPAPQGGTKPQGSATGVQIVKLRVRVRTRAQRGIDGAEVSVTAGPVTKTEVTDNRGFTKTFTFTQEEIEAAKNKLLVRSKKKHHGPDPTGVDKVVPGNLETELTVGADGIDKASPGMDRDAMGPFLGHVMMDAGMNRGGLSNAITRRLTAEEIQNELIFAHRLERIRLTADSEFQFDHDPASGMFDPCTASCKVRSPTIDRWVTLADSVIGDVTFYHLESTVPSPARKDDVLPGQRFTRDTFSWSKGRLQSLDQRQVAGLIRLCRELNRDHDVVAIYDIGISGDSARADCHGYGLAVDFGGCGLAPPPSKKLGVRLGVDFFVFLHWGNVPMWDPKLVAQNPTTPSAWKRLPVEDRFDRTDFTADPSGKTIRLHFSLDPAPYQDPVPPGTSPDLSAKLAELPLHFRIARELFLAVYTFATREYSDQSSTLGPDPGVETPTPIDSHQGHFTLHPDYPKPNGFATDANGNRVPDPNRPGKDKEKPNGRGAHFNHFHIQLGPTNYRDANKKEIFRTK